MQRVFQCDIAGFYFFRGVGCSLFTYQVKIFRDRKPIFPGGIEVGATESDVDATTQPNPNPTPKMGDKQRRCGAFARKFWRTTIPQLRTTRTYVRTRFFFALLLILHYSA